MSALYDKDTLLRFVNDVLALPASTAKVPDEEARKAAAYALMDALNGVNVRRECDIPRKKRGKVLEPDCVTIDDPLFTIMFQLAAGKLNEKQARASFKEALEGRTPKVPVGDRTVMRYMKAIQPRAEALHDTKVYLESLAEK